MGMLLLIQKNALGVECVFLHVRQDQLRS
jgi:hypothetical protein